MSVTVIDKFDERHPTQHRRDDLEAVFDEFVFESADVCSRCFSRVRVNQIRARTGIVGHDVKEHEQADPQRTTSKRDQDEVSYGSSMRTYPQRTTCGECGSVGCRAEDDPLSRREALAVVPNLVERLRERGHLVDEHVTREFVRSAKSRSALSSFDTEIFRRAAVLGAERATGNDDP